MKIARTVALAFVILLCAGCATSSTAASDPVIVTERINWCGPNWETSFTPQRVVQEVDDTCIRPGQYTQSFQPSPEAWNAVIEALAANEFKTLPAVIETPSNEDGSITIVADDPQSCITFENHRVCGAHYSLNHTPEGKRFLRIWSALVQIAPEPRH